MLLPELNKARCGPNPTGGLILFIQNGLEGPYRDPADPSPGRLSIFVDTQMSASRTILFGLTLLAGAGATALGFWQLGRLADRKAQNTLAMADALASVTDLNREALGGRITYRRVTVTGEYDAKRDFLIRGRLLRGTPGVQIVTPLRVAGMDSAILVIRGFVPTPDAGAPLRRDGFAEPGPLRVDGIAIETPDGGDGQPLVTERGETWHRLDWSALRARLPYPIVRYYVLAGVDTTRTRDHTIRGRLLPIRIDPPPLDDGPHLSYAIQWFMIGGAALGFGLVFVRGRNRASDLVPAD